MISLNAYIKHQNNPIIFAEKLFQSIKIPTVLPEKVALSSYQKKIINSVILGKRFNFFIKFRQSGFTTMAVVVALWHANFNPKSKIIIISPRLDSLNISKNIIANLAVVYGTKHEWTKNKKFINFYNESSIEFETAERFKQNLKNYNGFYAKIPIEDKFDLFIGDEILFNEELIGIFSTIKYHCIKANGKMMVFSSLGNNGNGQVNQKIKKLHWENIMVDDDTEKRILPWFSDETKDFSWHQDAKRRYSISDFRPEYECDLAWVP